MTRTCARDKVLQFMDSKVAATIFGALIAVIPTTMTVVISQVRGDTTKTMKIDELERRQNEHAVSDQAESTRAAKLMNETVITLREVQTQQTYTLEMLRELKSDVRTLQGELIRGKKDGGT